MSADVESTPALVASVSVPVPEGEITQLHTGPRDVCYQHVINFARSSVKGQHSCVMCGKTNSKDCVIPSQNKDVCKVCDSLVWLSKCQSIEFKFCKGCKNFVSIFEFCDKPKASKCGKCRNRCRSSYSARRSSSGSSDSYDHDAARYHASDSPRGIADMVLCNDGEQYFHAGAMPVKKATPPGSRAGICQPLSSSTKRLQDMSQYYGYDRDRDAAVYLSPMYGGGSMSPVVGLQEKENRGNLHFSVEKHTRPKIGGVLGAHETEMVKTPKASTPALLPRIPNSLLNIHSSAKRENPEAHSTPEPNSIVGKGVLDDLLLLNSTLRKSPLTFISGMPSPDAANEFVGFSADDFSPSQHHRSFLEHRMGAHTPLISGTPTVDGGRRHSLFPSPVAGRSWDSQEGGAWYHDVLVAMSKDQSVKKSPAIRRSHSMDETEMPVAKRIRYGDIPSPAKAFKSRNDTSPPSTPWAADCAISAARGSASCPLAPREGMVKIDGVSRIERSASCSKAMRPTHESKEKWEWDPNANPLMHLAMVLSKNESDEEEIFRDLSSDSTSSDGGSDSDSVHSFTVSKSPPSSERNSCLSVPKGISAM